jgi:hypothetical protein
VTLQKYNTWSALRIKKKDDLYLHSLELFLLVLKVALFGVYNKYLITLKIILSMIIYLILGK